MKFTNCWGVDFQPGHGHTHTHTHIWMHACIHIGPYEGWFCESSSEFLLLEKNRTPRNTTVCHTHTDTKHTWFLLTGLTCCSFLKRDVELHNPSCWQMASESLCNYYRCTNIVHNNNTHTMWNTCMYT